MFKKNKEKELVEPLSLDILKRILNINDFSQNRKVNAQIFEHLMETKEIKYMSEMFLYNLEYRYQDYKKKFQEKNEETYFNGIYYVCNFYLSFISSLIINNYQYQEYLQIKTSGFDILKRDFKSKGFKLLDPYLQLISLIDTYLEDVIYKAYNMMFQDDKSINISEFNFDVYYEYIKNLIWSYNKKIEKSSWNIINNNWHEICIEQQK